MGKQGGDTGNTRSNIQNINSCFFLQKFVELVDKNLEYTTELIQAIIAADENLTSMVN